MVSLARPETNMGVDANLPCRRSLRLRHHDYSEAGAYFVTVCVESRRCVLGRVDGPVVILSACGTIVYDAWTELPTRFPGLELDAFQVMPNHVHGILIFGERSSAAGTTSDGARPVPTRQAAVPPENTRDTMLSASAPSDVPLRRLSLPRVVGAFKSISAIACNHALGATSRAFWQQRYYEHVVRDEADLNRIRQYIIENPAKWSEDRENPERYVR